MLSEGAANVTINQIRTTILGVLNANWAAAGDWVEDDELFLEMYWRGHFAQIKANGIVRATHNQQILFATVPTILYWAHRFAGDAQGDMVIKEP